jgi:hypothetical protein
VLKNCSLQKQINKLECKVKLHATRLHQKLKTCGNQQQRKEKQLASSNTVFAAALRAQAAQKWFRLANNSAKPMR